MAKKKTDDPYKYLNFKEALILSLLFLALYLSYMVVQDLMSELQKANGFGSLGFFLVGLIFLFQTIASIVSVPICSKLGLKKTGFIGGLLLTMVVVCQIPPSMRAKAGDDVENMNGFMQFFLSRGMALTFSILGSAVGGFGQGMLWVMQGEYISLCATEASMGLYFGIGWGFYMGSQIFGNLIGSYLIEATSGPWFFVTLSLIQIIPCVCFLFIKIPKPFPVDEQLIKEEEVEQEAHHVKKDHHHVTMSMKGSRYEHAPPGFKAMIAETFEYMLSYKMMFLNFQSSFSGVSIAYYSGLLTPLMVLQQEDQLIPLNSKISNAFMAMVLFGVGEVAGSLFSGVVSDLIGRRTAALYNVALIAIMLYLTIYNLNHLTFGVLSYLMCLSWGWQDATVNVNLFSFLGFEFENKSAPFGVFNAVQGLALFAIEILQSFLDFENERTRMGFTWAVGIYGMFAVFLPFFFPKPKPKATVLPPPPSPSTRTTGNGDRIQEKSSQQSSLL